VTAVATEERCPVTELVRDQCAHCRPRVADEDLLVAAALGTAGRVRSWPEPEHRRVVRRAEAVYNTGCPGNCGNLVHLGDPIFLVRGADEDLWVCAACADAP